MDVGRCRVGSVFHIYGIFSRDFDIVLIILKMSGMGKWYSWDFDCLIFRE